VRASPVHKSVAGCQYGTVRTAQLRKRPEGHPSIPDWPLQTEGRLG